jgi:hypothetical protein
MKEPGTYFDFGVPLELLCMLMWDFAGAGQKERRKLEKERGGMQRREDSGVEERGCRREGLVIGGIHCRVSSRE